MSRTFNVNQNVDTSAEQIEEQLTRAKELFMQGEPTALIALMATYSGNPHIESAINHIVQAKKEISYRKWLESGNPQIY